jgi:hypothetical protein
MRHGFFSKRKKLGWLGFYSPDLKRGNTELFRQLVLESEADE